MRGFGHGTTDSERKAGNEELLSLEDDLKRGLQSQWPRWRRTLSGNYDHHSTGHGE